MITLTDGQLDDMFREDGSGRLHDALVEALGPTDATWDEDYLKKLFKWLPENIQLTAITWGLHDTEFGDQVVHYLKTHALPPTVKDNK